MDDVEGEQVARQDDRNRESTQMDANFCERDRPGRCGVRLAPGSEKKVEERDVFGGTPNTAVETTALPMNRISKHSRLLASIGGSVRNSLICKLGLMQVVDFHDISGYFSWFLWRPFAVMVQFLKVRNRLTQVVDFHESFSYF